MKNKIVVIALVAFVIFGCNSKTNKEVNANENSTTYVQGEEEVIKDSSLTKASSVSQNDLCELEWTLTSTSELENVETQLKNNLPYLKFNVDGSFNAVICNTINGKYATNDTSSVINLTNFSQTKKMCEGTVMKIENAFKAGDYEYDITKGYLTLSVGDFYFTFNRKTTSSENKMAN